MFFADDSLLFCKANKADCDVLCDILKSYEEASGQMVNFDKSSILFSPNTSSEDKAKAMDALKIHKQMGAENYLGLPIMFGRSKKMVFRAIKERIGSQTKSWSSRLLSQAGKSVLLQAVAQAIPIFVMNCFKLPKGFLNDLNMTMAKFWWGDSSNKSKIHWRKWETLCCSKMIGGLGFKEMESFNLALLAKQWWRIIHNEKSLSFRVLKGKYFPNSEPMTSPKGPNSSYLWNSLWEGRRIVEQGATWRVGDGRRIDVWVDPWLKKGPDGRVTHPYGVVPTNLKVCCLIDMERRE